MSSRVRHCTSDRSFNSRARHELTHFLRILARELCAFVKIICRACARSTAGQTAEVAFAGAPRGTAAAVLSARKTKNVLKNGTLTPGIGPSITRFPSFLDRLGMENRAHFSYALGVFREYARLRSQRMRAS